MAFVNLYRFNREIASFAEEEVKAKVVLFIKKLAMDLLRGEPLLNSAITAGITYFKLPIRVNINSHY